MPNRLIKESCRTSPTLAKLSDAAERLWWRLLTEVDDYGRCDADPMIILGACVPLLAWPQKKVASCLSELEKAGLIIRYIAGDRTLLQFATMQKHNRMRAKTSKYPPPSADICQQMTADDSRCQHPLLYSESESESESDTYSESESEAVDKIKSPDVPKQILSYYYDQYKSRHGIPPQVSWKGKDRQVAKSLLAGPPERSTDEVQALIDEYLASNDQFCADKGWPLYLLPSQINKLLKVSTPAGCRQGLKLKVLNEPG